MAIGDYISEIQTSDGNTHLIGSSVWVSTEEWNGKTITEVETEIKTKFSNLTEITWSSLKSLVDTGSLIPGMQYRITDYTCTTTQNGTKSAGHVFDIIVTADDKSTLNEVARAAKHEGDTYFANNDLSAWKLWYCLDNDTTQFKWADKTNGKGVIYRMIDEFDNDCPYDFKNIQFYRQWDEVKQLWSTISQGAVGMPCYTFSSKGDNSATKFTDTTLMLDRRVYCNTIKACALSNQVLNNNCFFGDGCNYNTFGYDCQNNTFKNNCQNNTFGNTCNNNTFWYDCWNNSFGSSCQNNSFESSCQNNSFGNNCQNNTFKNNCQNNTFGENCNYNTFGSSCQNNSFGNNCQNNSFGSNCSYNSFEGRYQNNSFGSSCQNNSFGSNCSYNSFGENCNYNTFGISCLNNSFGSNCLYNSFGRNCDANTFEGTCLNNSFGNDCDNNIFESNCNYNSFGSKCWGNSFGHRCQNNSFESNCNYIKFASDKSASTKYDYYRDNHFGDGCQYIVFTGIGSADSHNQVQNYNFAQGLQGTSSAYITIDGVRNRAYETKVAKNSAGELKVYCEADLIK